MSDFFVLPDDSFEPDIDDNISGFEPNISPTFIRRVDLVKDGHLYADIFAEPDFVPEAELLDFSDLEGYFNPDFGKPLGFEYLPMPEDFDIQDPHVRGPFLRPSQVRKFLDESGLDGVAIVYYDKDTRYFWIDVNTN